MKLQNYLIFSVYFRYKQEKKKMASVVLFHDRRVLINVAKLGSSSSKNFKNSFRRRFLIKNFIFKRK
jgi:hypothetical protein